MGPWMPDLRALCLAVSDIEEAVPFMAIKAKRTFRRSPPFHEARTQAELTKLIRDGRIPNMPSVYSRRLQDTVKSMLQQDVSFFY